MIKRRTLLGAAAAGLAAPALAQGWMPERPMRLVVPFAAGGPADLIGRTLAHRMGATLRQTMVVENRGGGGGVVGMEMVAKSAPDGLTIGFGSAGSLAISPSLLPAMPYAVPRDLTPVTLVAAVMELLTISPSTPARTMAELVAYARANPGRLNFGSSGNGSMPHLAGEQLRFTAGIDITHVPYRGIAPTVPDLISGQIQFIFADMPAVLEQVRAGTLRGLAVASPERFSGLPEIPTTAEAGFADVQAENWFGLVVPARTPPAITAALHAAAVAALQEPETRTLLGAQGARLGGNTPTEFLAFIQAETVKWGEIVRRSGVRPD